MPEFKDTLKLLYWTHRLVKSMKPYIFILRFQFSPVIEYYFSQFKNEWSLMEESRRKPSLWFLLKNFKNSSRKQEMTDVPGV